MNPAPHEGDGDDMRRHTSILLGTALGITLVLAACSSKPPGGSTAQPPASSTTAAAATSGTAANRTTAATPDSGKDLRPGGRLS